MHGYTRIENRSNICMNGSMLENGRDNQGNCEVSGSGRQSSTRRCVMRKR